MFTSLYRPKSVTEFVGNTTAIDAFKEWLLQWNANNLKTKCALVTGPSGVGKHTLIELVLREYNYHIVYVNMEEKEIEKEKNFIHSSLHIKCTCDGRPNALVLTQVDSILIKGSEVPVVLICEDRWDQTVKSILPYCIDIKLSKPSYEEVYRLMYQVATSEKIRIKESEIQALYEQAHGDIRFMLNALQLRNNKNKFVKDLQSTNIFDSTSKLLSMEESVEEKYQTYWLNSEMHPLMVQENYVNTTFNLRDELRKLDNLAASSCALSSADIFLNGWDTSAYGAYSVLQATATCNKKGVLKFPQILGKMSVWNKNRREKGNCWDSFSSLFDKEKKVEVEQPKSKLKKERKTKEPKTKQVKTTKDKNLYH